MSKGLCLRVPKNLGEKAIRLTDSLSLFDRKLKVQQVESHVYIPLIREPLPREVSKLNGKLTEFEIVVHTLPEYEKQSFKIDELLADNLPPHLLAMVPRAIDFVGEIAIIDIPPELRDYGKEIGEAILGTFKRVKTVLSKSSAVRGDYRLREFTVLAGAERMTTVHKEYGTTYHVDLAKAYFSPRLSYEHNRVASQVEEGEIVFDMFAGVGPFSIQIAKKLEDVQVYAIDLNPHAVNLLKRNIAVNRVENKIVVIHGDVKQVSEEKLMGIADRVIMNLPEKAIEYIDWACEAIKSKGGIIHYYGFGKAPSPLNGVKLRLFEAVERTNRKVKKVLLAKIVRATAPFTWQVVVDIEIQ